LRRRKLNLAKLLCVALGAFLSVAGVPSMMAFLTEEPVKVEYICSGNIEEKPPIEGMTYAFAEIECRQWHRNRFCCLPSLALK
jgi:hypothetical protein